MVYACFNVPFFNTTTFFRPSAHATALSPFQRRRSSSRNSWRLRSSRLVWNARGEINKHWFFGSYFNSLERLRQGLRITFEIVGFKNRQQDSLRLESKISVDAVYYWKKIVAALSANRLVLTPTTFDMCHVNTFDSLHGIIDIDAGISYP